MLKNCQLCKLKTKINHFNTKYCEPCRLLLLKKPKGTLTNKQKELAISLAGTIPREEVAKIVGCSTSNLKRSCPGTRFVFHNKYIANPSIVKEVCSYYGKHGKEKTQKKFPDVNVRSIVERYKLYRPRQIKWKPNELVEVVKMAGLISLKGQARYFNRPRANEGSIKSVWAKTLKVKHLNKYELHGLPKNKAHYICKKTVPFITTKFGPQNSKFQYKIALWPDVYKHLKPNIPAHWKEAIGALVRFQQKLFGGDVKREIKKIIRVRDMIKESQR